MKEINLREFYPFYTQDAIVEVPDEVAALLHELKLAEAASFLRTYRKKMIGYIRRLLPCLKNSGTGSLLIFFSA